MKQTYSGTRRQAYGTMTETRSTSSMKMEKSRIIILMVISALCLVITPLGSALEFKFYSPESVYLNESFSVSLSAETDKIYDVKIFIEDANSNVLSEIFDGEWRNPYTYIKASFPLTSEYQIKLVKTAESYEICCRLRESGKTTYVQNCNKLLLLERAESAEPGDEINEGTASPSSNETDSVSDNNETSSLEPELEQEEEAPSPAPSKKSSSSTSSQSATSESSSEVKKIIIRQPNKNSQVYFSADEKLRRWALYSFLGLCVFVIIFLALRKL